MTKVVHKWLGFELGLSFGIFRIAEVWRMSSPLSKSYDSSCFMFTYFMSIGTKYYRLNSCTVFICMNWGVNLATRGQLLV